MFRPIHAVSFKGQLFTSCVPAVVTTYLVVKQSGTNHKALS